MKQVPKLRRILLGRVDPRAACSPSLHGPLCCAVLGCLAPFKLLLRPGSYFAAPAFQA
jgi:hypothetical protein